MSTPTVPKDLREIRRYITTHTADGETTFSGAIPVEAPFKPLPDGAEFALCYATDRFPVPLGADADLASYGKYSENLPGITIPTGSVLRVVDMPPGALSPMHRTISLDYGVVLEGEIELILDSGESRVMKRGDISVQRATNHSWRNLNPSAWARMLYVLQPAEPMLVSGQNLEDNTTSTIPGYEAPH